MNRNLTTQVVQQGDNELSKIAMREHRDQLLSDIQAVEDGQKQIPETQIRKMLSELFDLNIAIGDVAFEDKDGDNE